jgi:septal ring factor EnvC (AmiA/AmiB activator)
MVWKKFATGLFAVVLATAAGLAYTSDARNSLLRSRDQVADQRFQLEKAYSEVDRKIQELQQQKYSIGKYLQDCDRTIRDIDKALSAQDAAYHGR